MARAVRGDASIGFEGALLFNGSILIERASLTLAQKLLRSRRGTHSRTRALGACERDARC
jgi:hypothetical protein